MQESFQDFSCDITTMQDGSILYFLQEDYEIDSIPSKCYTLEHGNWKIHSILNKDRYNSSIVKTKYAIFAFGGFQDSCHTFEYLNKGTTKWIIGKNKIPGEGFKDGCAIATKSEEEILLIGGDGHFSRRILSFNTQTHTFRELPTRLILERYAWRQCLFIPGTNKIIMISGTKFEKSNVFSDALILDLNHWSMTIASPMNTRRADPCIGILTVNEQDRIAAIGGYSRKAEYGGYPTESIELYDAKTGTWENANFSVQNTVNQDHTILCTMKIGDLSGLGLWLKIPSKLESLQIHRRF